MQAADVVLRYEARPVQAADLAEGARPLVRDEDGEMRDPRWTGARLAVHDLHPWRGRSSSSVLTRRRFALQVRTQRVGRLRSAALLVEDLGRGRIEERNATGLWR